MMTGLAVVACEKDHNGNENVVNVSFRRMLSSTISSMCQKVG